MMWSALLPFILSMPSSEANIALQSTQASPVKHIYANDPDNAKTAKLSSLCSPIDLNGKINISLIGYWMHFRVDPPELQFILDHGEKRYYNRAMFFHGNLGKAICDPAHYKPLEFTDSKHPSMRGRVILYTDSMSPKDYIVMDFPNLEKEGGKVRIRNGTMTGEIDRNIALNLILNSAPETNK